MEDAHVRCWLCFPAVNFRAHSICRARGKKGAYSSAQMWRNDRRRDWRVVDDGATWAALLVKEAEWLKSPGVWVPARNLPGAGTWVDKVSSSGVLGILGI